MAFKTWFLLYSLFCKSSLLNDAPFLEGRSSRIGKKPVLAIEVDGYEYHKEDTVQASRDLLKNHIMELYEIPLLRFMTNGSGEREKIVEMLDNFV